MKQSKNRRSLNSTKLKTKAGDKDDFARHLKTRSPQTHSLGPQKTQRRSTNTGVCVLKQGFGSGGCKKDGQRKKTCGEM